MEYKELLIKVKDKFKKLTSFQRAVIIIAGIALLVVLIYLVNPPKKLREWRNSTRRSDVAKIINVAYQYQIDTKSLPEEITSSPKFICRTKAENCEGMVNFSAITNEKKYQLPEVPIDPTEKNLLSTGYQIEKLSNGRIKVLAPNAENNATISLSK